jgi:GAF domain-containing protein/HAMP domain-containing protein
MTTAVDARTPADGIAGAKARAPKAGPRRRLFAKYAAALVGMVSLVLLINASLDVWFSYDEAKDAALRLQREKAEAAAQRIETFIDEIERQIGWTTATQWASSPIEQRRFDYSRLLRQVPAITELSQLDSHGHEQLRVSRLSMDVVGSDADFSTDPRFTEALAKKVWFGPVYFRKESEPYMTMAVAQSGRNAGVTVAEVNLKLIWDVITAIKIGKTGYAYVVDDKGRLIAHPDISRVLRNTDVSGLPQVTAARSSPGEAAEPAAIVRNLDGHRVLSASAAIPRLGWLVFVEQPIGEALAPLYTSLRYSGLLLVLGLAVAILAGLLLARRMTGPIRVLDAGAARIGAGALDHRIAVHTGDELEELAQRFNTMAADLQSSYADLEKKVEDRTAELKEALDQQTATAEVLQVINSSPGDLTPVFDAILEKAMRLCEADFGFFLRYQNSEYLFAGGSGLNPAFTEYLLRMDQPGSNEANTRILQGAPYVHIVDMKDDEPYRSGAPFRRAIVDLGGGRTGLGVPMRKDHYVLGTFNLARFEVRPFTNKQIALVQNFAAQAVIAIENARLITELRDRTHDLQESLEYQTASGDVLKVISQSGRELEPVLDTLVETAARICRADSGFVFRLQDGLCRMVAGFGFPAEYKEFQQRNPIAPSRGTLAGRTVLGRRAVHIEDAATDPEYTRVEAVQVGRQRTMLGVPLIREDALIGVITLARSYVEPFTEKQIGLVTTFADQAVIAIENARLFNELRASTAELGRSVEELKMLSEVGQAVSSTLDLRSVLSAILTASLGVTWANAGAIFSYSRADRSFRLAEAVGWDEVHTHSIRDLRVAESETAMGEAVAHRMPIQLADLADRASYPLSNAALAAGFHSVLIVPLVGAERILGAITLMRQEAGEFPPETVRLMQTLASQSVLAIQNARLFRD